MFIVGGTFDKDGGKPSFFISEMMRMLDIQGLNGGYLSDLGIDFKHVDTLIWMPDIDNSEDKILPTIKSKYPHILLVQSKRMIDGNYTDSDIVGRLLKSRCILGITIKKTQGHYLFKLVDPLGNIHCETLSLSTLCMFLKDRLTKIAGMTRMSSTRVGDVKEFSVDDRFIEIIKNLGTQFATFVNAVNPNRLLGNASTRCASGFPAIREENKIFVSRRNVDKQTLSSEDFVEVGVGKDTVEYYGSNKPSVDTPIQLGIFSLFPNIKYIIHGHVYVKDAPMTLHKIPCGYLEEIGDILDVITDRNIKEFSVNLHGHGCLIACSDLDYFDTVELEGRPFPEYW